ncbi:MULTISPECIES: hypothetical protein [unclassified Spirillospora]|uniref:hypothetical protein n=1 Tax=unclassified Spirillospora TaxID=2642701 RepID=UPI00371E36E5
MEDSRTDPVPGAPYPVAGIERRAAWEHAAWNDERTAWERAGWEQPSERAHPLLVLTPVPEVGVTREPWPGAVHVVTGIAILVAAAGLGRRVGVPAPLTAVCSAAGFAVVVVPRLVSSAPRPRPRFRPDVAFLAAH